jgi:hypothetical protein
VSRTRNDSQKCNVEPAILTALNGVSNVVSNGRQPTEANSQHKTGLERVKQEGPNQGEKQHSGTSSSFGRHLMQDELLLHHNNAFSPDGRNDFLLRSDKAICPVHRLSTVSLHLCPAFSHMEATSPQI